MSREASRSAISGLAIDYSGPLPDLGGYVPLQQEGAIILGTDGDNSNRSSGFFFERVLTAGFAPAATDDVIQANIVATGYHRVAPVS